MPGQLKPIEDAVRAAIMKQLGIDMPIEVEERESLDNEVYLLVKVRLPARQPSTEQLADLVEEVENRVADVDDRYPSIRFLEAA